MTVASALAQLQKGDKIDVASGIGWSSPLIVVAATETERWRVPFDDDWFFREVVVETSGGTQYRAEVGVDGDVRLFREYDDEEKNLGKVTSVEKVGEVSRERKLRLAEPDELGLSAIGERRAV
ncbi:MAG: hypothetical protein ABEJ73_12340 [Haloplanus sp.]